MNVIDYYSENSRLEKLTALEIIRQYSEKFGASLKLASSLGLEDQVLTHMLSSFNSQAKVFVLDTGMLNKETYQLLELNQTVFDLCFEIYDPISESVETMVKTYGLNLFYDSIENRKKCCFVRKVEPLGRALSTAKAWITGIRRQQSPDRSNTPFLEWDSSHNIIKINPLINWSENDVWHYIKKYDIPYNQLHDKGYPSIGCEPCTRAIKPGEPSRAGRWWWEDASSKECGLHVNENKSVEDKDK